MKNLSTRRKTIPANLPCGLVGPVVISAEERRVFGETLRELRHERGLSQETLARKADLAVDTVRRIESGGFSPSMETLSRLVVGLEISLFSLFARLDGQRFADAADFWDFLCSRPTEELKIARRVLEALFEGFVARPRRAANGRPG